ncbi:MAG: hypothetical protein AAGB51_07995 [Planctomycetota bacterium]
MLRRFRRNLDLPTRGLLMRRQTERWLTRRLAAGSTPVPRVPARQESEGGYEHERRTPEGRAWADEWWDRTLEGVPDD